ncbi:hypothetical protein DXG01_004043 [Tephrocybe rancida]|nr:hypothetical protein DXG01_004043 [Tephrocybe rancida]
MSNLPCPEVLRHCYCNQAPAVPNAIAFAFEIHRPWWFVSMPFNYYPRSRPATPLPSPLTASRRGFNDALNWTCHQSEIRPKGKNIEPIKTKLYIPASRTFCISQSIPFHLMFESSAYSLAAFLPYCPTASFIKRKQATRIQLMRQSTADGPSWTAFSGEINISETVKVTGFKVAGLSVKDCILFAMMPPDQQRSPFAELRQLVPVKLTTDAWVADGTGVGATLQHAGSEYSLSSVLDHTEETVHG